MVASLSRCSLLLLTLLSISAFARDSFSAQKIRSQSVAARRQRHSYPTIEEKAPKTKKVDTSFIGYHLRQDAANNAADNSNADSNNSQAAVENAQADALLDSLSTSY